MQHTDVIPPPVQGEMVLILLEAFLILTLIGAVIYWLHTHKKPHQGFDVTIMRMSPTVITVVMLLIAVFGPVAFNIYPRVGIEPMVYLMGMTWQMHPLIFVDFMFSIVFLLFTIPLMFFRLVFVYQMHKYFRRLTSRKRTIIVGIIGEIQFPVIGLFIIPFAINDPYLLVLFSIPIPILLLVGLAIIQFVKVPKPIDGWEALDQSPDWWDKDSQSEPESK
jgi:hypothetical protein